jgi:hypothetical protein
MSAQGRKMRATDVLDGPAGGELPSACWPQWTPIDGAANPVGVGLSIDPSPAVGTLAIPLRAQWRECPMAKRADIEMALRRLAPRIPPYEFGVVVDHAMDSPGLSAGSPQAAAWLSLVAYVRHDLTEYDALLEQGYDRDSARFFVAAETDAILSRWGVCRRVSSLD